MNFKVKAAAAVICASALVLAGNVPAFAQQSMPTNSVTTTTHQDAEAGSYSDHDIISFLVLGTGPIYEAHKALTPYAPETDSVPIETQDEMLALYLETEPAFNALVTVPLQSGDPRLVDQALASFSEISYDVAVKLGLEVPDKEEFISTGSIIFVIVVAAVAGAAVATVAAAVNVRTVVNTVDFWGTSPGKTAISYEKRAAQFAVALGK